jgi:hypothetical protein
VEEDVGVVRVIFTELDREVVPAVRCRRGGSHGGGRHGSAQQRRGRHGTQPVLGHQDSRTLH